MDENINKKLRESNTHKKEIGIEFVEKNKDFVNKTQRYLEIILEFAKTYQYRIGNKHNPILEPNEFTHSEYYNLMSNFAYIEDKFPFLGEIDHFKETRHGSRYFSFVIQDNEGKISFADIRLSDHDLETINSSQIANVSSLEDLDYNSIQERVAKIKDRSIYEE